MAEFYKPTATDQRWLHQLLQIVRDGGHWGTSFATYSVDKEHRQLRVVAEGVPLAGETWPVAMNRERVKAVAAAIGWSVVD